MSAFGQYVHLHWENYEKAGTYEYQPGNPLGQKNNFSSSIFRNHKIAVGVQARTKSINQIKELENKYNKITFDTYSKLKGVMTKKTPIVSNTDFISLISKTWISNANAIMSNLQWDSNSMRLVLNKKNGIGVFHDTVVPKGYGTSFKKLSLTKKTQIKTFNNQIDKLCNAFKIMGLTTELSTLINIQTALKNYEQNQKKILSSIDPSMIIDSLDPNQPMANSIITVFNNFIDGYQSFNTLQKYLDWKIPEILGNLGTQGILEVTDSALNSVLQEIKLAGQKMSAPLQGGTQGFYKKLDQATLKKLANDQNFAKVVTKRLEKKNTVTYKIAPVGMGRAQKADVEWIIDNEQIGISLKTTGLLEKKNSKYNTIQLQSSALSLFLQGLYPINNDLPNHYLNILADHEDESGLYHTMREQANEALQLAIGYSALTGANQLRQGGQANIFAVWDKDSLNGQPKIKFFDIGTIMTKLDVNPKELILSPTINSLSLTNESLNQKGSVRKNAQIRITKLLAEARSITIKTSLSKNFLNNIYK